MEKNLETTLKEDIQTVGEVSPEQDVIEAKKAFIKKAYASENLNLDNLSTEELDNLIGKVPVNEKLEKINDIIKYSLTERLDPVETLHEIVGFKINEAQDVYFDYLSEKRIREAENAQNLTTKEKEEILTYCEPEQDTCNIGKNQFDVKKVDHTEDLKKQDGEKFKGVKDGDF